MPICQFEVIAVKRSSSWKSVTLLTCLVLLHGKGAAAETVCPEAPSPSQARQLAADQFNEAERLFEANDCRCVARFQCSFELFPHPNTLFNMARSAERCTMHELALSSYQRFIEVYPDEAGRPEVESRLQSLEEQMAHLEQDPEPEPPVPQPPVEPPSDVDDELPGGSGARVMSIVGWAAFGLGMGTAITGGVLIGVAESVYNDFTLRQAAGAPQSELLELRDRGQSLTTTGAVLLGIGSAVLTAGVIVFLIARRRRLREQTSLRPPGGPSIGFEPWMLALVSAVRVN